MINVHDILETIKMIDEEYLDVRTITMGFLYWTAVTVI